MFSLNSVRNRLPYVADRYTLEFASQFHLVLQDKTR